MKWRIPRAYAAMCMCVGEEARPFWRDPFSLQIKVGIGIQIRQIRSGNRPVQADVTRQITLSDF